MTDTAGDRRPFDVAAYHARVHSGLCFVCAYLAGDPKYAHQQVYADEVCVAFLSRYPTQRGYTLVSPRAHVVEVTGDRALFGHVTGVVHDVAEALKRVVSTERIYLMSLGSHQGNAHVHWHVVPLPPGVPYERQQYAAVMHEHGMLDVSEPEQAALARRLSAEVTRIRHG